MRNTVVGVFAGKEFPTPERCLILEVWNTPDDDAASIAQARVAPGVTTQLHRLVGIDERYIVIHGTGRVEIGNHAPELVGVGDIRLIPRGVAQRITNAGDEDLIFLCLCTPRFRKDSYESLEES